MIGILNMSVPRERFTHVIEQGPEHFRPIMEAARDHGVGVCVVPQGPERFHLPRKLPNIVIVGDDMREAKGPDAFHRKSLVRFIKRASGAVIVSSAPVTAAYAAAATNAPFPATRSRRSRSPGSACRNSSSVPRECRRIGDERESPG